jgi:ubiquinone biosynthesis protein COQ4
MAEKRRIRPLDALRAIRALIKNPDDTPRVFDVIDALSGNHGERLFARFRRSAGGARLLASRPNLLAVLSDRQHLLGLPPGTLGRTYGEFMGREQISADGLVQASMEGGRGLDPDLPPERAWFGARLRDMHDLWHVVTGYNRDLIGEAALLSFTFAQTKNPGIGFIVLVAWLRATGDFHWARPMIREGYRRGRRAAWLPEQAWEELLSLPISQVRSRLGLGEPPVYAQVRSAEAPALA